MGQRELALGRKGVSKIVVESTQRGTEVTQFKTGHYIDKLQCIHMHILTSFLQRYFKWSVERIH